MNRDVGQVTGRKVRGSITVNLSKGIITYQKHMGRVDCGEHHRLMGAGLSNVAHFKNW